MKKRAFFVVTVAIIALLLLAQIASVSAAPAKKGPPVKPTDTPAGPTDTPAPTKTPGGSDAWTFMFYVVGDNNLEDYVMKDIETEMGYSNDDINIIALADRHPGYSRKNGNWTQTLLFYVTPGTDATEEDAVEDWGERNMGDAQTLIDFISWCKTNYPADNYALVLWDHGWMWRPYQSMWDETDDGCLDPHEIVYAIGQVGAVDVVGYDACLGMCIENAAMWRDLGADAIVASEDTMGMGGFETEDVFPQLQNNPSMTASQVAYEIAESVGDYTSSSADLDADFDALITAVDEWAVALRSGLSSHRSEIDTAWGNTKGMDDPVDLDLYDAAYQVKAAVNDATIDAKSQAVMDAVSAVVTYEWHASGWGYPDHMGGLAIFWPKNSRDLDEGSSPENDWTYYKNNLSFATDTHWDEFIDDYVQ